MARRRRRDLGGTLVLDAEGVSKAASDDVRVHAFLTSARNRDARVVMSAITLAEVLRGGPRDSKVHLVARRVSKEPVTAEIGREAGELLGKTGLAEATVDAVVGATALRQAGPVLILTSDPKDLSRLVASRADVKVKKV
ncbi:MAG: type II toxin-antitoxin system VapC family toxin [Actinomycetota bacterium]